jgi:uncharacterized protein (TIGR00251 family)
MCKEMTIIETKDGVVLEVFVKPKSREFQIVTEGDEILVFCTEEPVKGKVNKEIIKEFSRLFNKRVELISGFTSKQKKLLIMGVQRCEVERIILRK